MRSELFWRDVGIFDRSSPCTGQLSSNILFFPLASCPVRGLLWPSCLVENIPWATFYSESNTRADQRSSRWSCLPFPSPILSWQYSSEARLAVASEEAVLGLEERGVQLLALAFDSNVAWRGFGGPVDVVTPRSCQYITGDEGQWKNILCCPRACCLLEEEVPALSEHGSLWIWTAREMSFSPVDVGFQESLLVPWCPEAASLA